MKFVKQVLYTLAPNMQVQFLNLLLLPWFIANVDSLRDITQDCGKCSLHKRINLKRHGCVGHIKASSMPVDLTGEGILLLSDHHGIQKFCPTSNVSTYVVAGRFHRIAYSPHHGGTIAALNNSNYLHVFIQVVSTDGTLLLPHRIMDLTFQSNNERKFLFWVFGLCVAQSVVKPSVNMFV